MGPDRPWFPSTAFRRRHLSANNSLNSLAALLIAFFLLFQKCQSQTLEVPGRPTGREYCEFDIEVLEDGENVQVDYECWGSVFVQFNETVALGDLKETELYPGLKVFAALADGMAIVQVSQAENLYVVNSTISGFQKGISAPIVVESGSTVWIDESEVSGNAGEITGGLMCTEGSAVKMDKVRFERNEGGKSGAVYANGEKSFVLMTNATFLQNVGRVMAADLHLENGARAFGDDTKFCNLERGLHQNELIEFRKGYFSNDFRSGGENMESGLEVNEAQSGSIYVSEGCELGLHNAEISWYVSLSGTIHGEKGSKIELNEVKILDNFGFKGAALYADGAKVKLTNCDINRNLGKIGGGVTALGDTELTVFNSTFMGNHGTLGGAIYMGHSLHEKCLVSTPEGSFSIENTTFADNVAQVDGGGIFAMCHDVKVVNSTFHSCKASKNGGAIYMESLASGKITDNTFYGCSGHMGGGVYAERVEKVDLRNSVLEENSASEGGGVCGVDSKRVDVTLATFQGNSADSYGGGLSLNSCASLVSLNATAVNNTAKHSGGGFALTETARVDLTGAIFEANHADKDGGGVFGKHVHFLIAEATHIKENEARNGAGLFVHNNATISNSTSHLERLMTNLVADEYPIENSSGNLLEDSANIYLSNSKFLNNNATARGGGAYIYHAEKVETWQCDFEGNYGAKYGGALYLKSIRNATIEKITGKTNEAGSAGGFGVIAKVENTQILDSKILENSGQKGAGGLYMTGSKRGPGVKCNVDIDRVVFKGNEAVKGEAGAAIAYECENVRFVDSIFKSNVALGSGGAVVTTKVNSTLFQGCSFHENEANGGPGGALYSSSYEGIDFSAINCEFVSNTATGKGGSICVAGEMPVVDLYNSTFHASSAKDYGGSVFIAHSVHVNMSDIELVDSNSGRGGGGVAVESAERVNMARTKFQKCESVDDGGGALFLDVAVVDGTESVFSECVSSEGSGGALFLNPAKHNSGSELMLEGCVAHGNSAKINGGAFHVKKISDVTVSKCELTRNRVETGRGGACVLESADTFNALSVTATGNAVGSSGGCFSLIHVGTADVSGVFRRNVAYKKYGGAIHGDYLTVLDISSTQFNANRGYLSGGAIHLENGESVHGTNVSFFGNEASDQFGGAMNLEAIQRVSLDESRFAHNGANSGGAVRLHELPPQIMDVSFKDVKFSFNTADRVGGAILVEGGVADRYRQRRKLMFFDENEEEVHVTVALENVLFHGNSAKTGGAVLAEEGKVTISNSSFEQNLAKSEGGAFSCGDGVSFDIKDVQFDGNKARRGSGLEANCGCEVEVTDSSFTGNIARGYKEGPILECNNNVALAEGTIYLDNQSGGRPWWHYLFLGVLCLFVAIAFFWILCFLRICFKKTLRKVKGEKVYHDYAAIGSLDPEAPNWDALGDAGPAVRVTPSSSLDSSVGSALPTKPMPNQTVPLDNRTLSSGRTTEDGMLMIIENPDPEPSPDTELPKKLDPAESMKKAWSFQPQSRKESPRSEENIEHDFIEPEIEQFPAENEQNEDSNLQGPSGEGNQD
ncbi:hypothetical protein BSKO_13610 [Bryopsis sp. KO-2023]|nr:hypothetical protein BSKO_13610 [Bryopsis sp. KO-2023]